MLPSFKVEIYGKVVLDSFLWFRVLVKALVRVEKDREIPVRAPGTKEATE